jgi:hypothetical protein
LFGSYANGVPPEARDIDLKEFPHCSKHWGKHRDGPTERPDLPGTSAEESRFSVAKSLASALVGIAIEKGYIGDVSNPLFYQFATEFDVRVCGTFHFD